MNEKLKEGIRRKYLQKKQSKIFETGILRFFLIVTTTIYCAQTVSSQDFITFPNGEFLKVKIIEAGTFEIKYNLYTSATNQQYTIERSKVYNVRYESGLIDFLDGRTVMMVSSQATVNNLQNLEQSVSGGKQIQKQAASGAIEVTTAKTATPATAAVTVSTPATVASAIVPPTTTTASIETINSTPEQSIANLLSGSTATTAREKKSLYSLYTAQINKAETELAPAAEKKTKRPTAFRNYGGLINIGIISEYSEFAGINFLLEGGIGNRDFGLGFEANILDMYYEMGARLSHHLPVSTFIDPYYGLRLFVAGEHDSQEFDEFGADFFIGTRLMFKKIGFFTEYHLNQEYLKSGISFSF